MTKLLAMMSMYYLCDQAAAVSMLDRQTMMDCMANYEALKLEFIDEPPAPLGSRERAAQSRLGYRGLKLWEETYPEEVARLKADAQAQLIGF